MHAAVVELAGQRSLAAAKLACNAVALFGVAPGADVLGAVIEACARHGSPGDAWPYLVALAARGLAPRELVLGALMACATAEAGARPAAALRRMAAAAAATEADATPPPGAAGDAAASTTTSSPPTGYLTPPHLTSSPTAAAAAAVAAAAGALRDDAGSKAVRRHALGLQVEALRGRIAEARAGAVADAWLAKAVEEVNDTYGMPLEEPLGEAGSGGGAGAAATRLLEELSLLELDDDDDDDDEGEGSGSEAGDDDDGGDGDDDGVVDEAQEAADAAVYARLDAEAQVVRAALFGGRRREDSLRTHAASAAVAAATPPPGGGAPSGPPSSSGRVVAPAPPATVLLPEWVLMALAAETARRELVATHLLPRMRDAAAATAAVAQAQPTPLAAGAGCYHHHPPTGEPPVPCVARGDGGAPPAAAAAAARLSAAAAAALESRLAFAARHSVLHVMPDSEYVGAAVARWRVAMLALARQAASATSRGGHSGGSRPVATAADGEGGASPAPSQSAPAAVLVRIPYLQLLTDPLADPRWPDTLLRLPGQQPQAAPAPALGGAPGGGASPPSFAELHPLFAAAGSPLPAAVRREVAQCLARVYGSLMVAEEQA